jgi:O-antigen/teichoic acid export membrane protein
VDDEAARGAEIPPLAATQFDAQTPDAARRIVRHVVGIGSANYVSAVLNAVRGILIARILGPDNYGIWSVLTLVLVWSQFADLGFGTAVTRQLPIARMEGDSAAAARAKSVSFGFKLGLTGIAALGIAIASLLVRSATYQEGLRVIAALALLQAVQQYGGSVLLAEHRVRDAGRLVILFAGLNLVAPVTGALVAGLPGVWWGLGFALFVTAVLYLRSLHVTPSVRVSRFELKRLAFIGLPLSASALISYNIVNVDQLVVARMLGSRELAFYTIALTTGALLYIAPSSVASILGPSVIERWRVGDARLEKFVWGPVGLLRDTYWFPVIAAIVLLGPAVRVLLPAYEPGVRAALLYLPGAYLLGINLGASTYLLALGRHWTNVPISLVAVLASAAVEVLLVRLGLGLRGIALGSTIGYLIYSAMHLTVVRVNLSDRLPAALANTSRMLIPAVLWTLVMLSYSVLSAASWAFVCAAFLALYTPLFIVPRIRDYAELVRSK